MRKYSFLLTLLVVLSACRHYSTYEDRDKWILTYRLTRMTLRNRPKEVTQYIYPAADTARPEVRKKYYSRYGFDPGGNIVFRNDYLNDSLYMTFEYRVDQDGLQQKSTNMKSGEVIYTVSKRLSDGRYMTTNPHSTNKSNAAIVGFLSGGDEKIREDYNDSTAHGDPYLVAHSYYQGNRLMKVAGRPAAGPQEALYFYSKSDSPDSLHIYQGSSASGNVLQRQLFFQNDHGDVAREIIIAGKDTTLLEENSYSYDARGNWVRRVQIPLKSNPKNYFGKEAMVIDREIVY